jgi:hypothetical protein
MATSEIDRRYAELIKLQVKQPAEDRREKPNWIKAIKCGNLFEYNKA